MPAAALNHRPEIKRALDEMLLGSREMSAGRAFGYPCYKVFGKVFVFVDGSGLGVKLPSTRVQELIESDDRCQPFEPKEGLVWKNWVSIRPLTPLECVGLAPLLDESAEYVVEKELSG